MVMDKLNVTVDEKNRRITLRAGSFGLWREIDIDITDVKSVVDGVLAAVNIGDSVSQARIAELATRVEALENQLKVHAIHSSATATPANTSSAQ